MSGAPLPARHLVVEDAFVGIPLDEFLAAHWPRVSKGRLRGLVRDGEITVDGLRALPADRLRIGQVVLLDRDPDTLPQLSTTSLPLRILHEDEHLVVVDKPAGFPVEPSRWGEHPVHLSGALLDWAEKRSGDGPLEQRPRGLHRLDLGTSGVLMYALSLEAERYYRGLFEAGLVEKTYHAVVVGEVHEGGTVDAPLAPDLHRGGMMRVDRHGKPSRTDYVPLEIFRGYTLVEARPRTGRTHQIRVHLASIGHPLAVDPRYGGAPALLLSHLKAGYRPKRGREERPLIERLTLHARAVSLVGFGGEALHFEAPYPKDFEVALTQLRKWRRPRSAR